MKKGDASRTGTAKRASHGAQRTGKRTGTSTQTCSRCGTTQSCPEGGIPPAWSMNAGPRGIEFLCSVCARANIRAIEGKLPEEYWE